MPGARGKGGEATKRRNAVYLKLSSGGAAILIFLPIIGSAATRRTESRPELLRHLRDQVDLEILNHDSRPVRDLDDRIERRHRARSVDQCIGPESASDGVAGAREPS